MTEQMTKFHGGDCMTCNIHFDQWSEYLDHAEKNNHLMGYQAEYV